MHSVKQIKAKLLPYVRLAIATLAPFSFAPYASALPAPPAPMITNNLPAKGEPTMPLPLPLPVKESIRLFNSY